MKLMLRLLGLLLLCGASACGPDGNATEASDKPENLIIVLVDTLRADHMSLYGYGRETSPFLDSLAEESLVFDRARSNSSFTRESIASLLTGRLPSLSGSTGWYAAPSDQLPTLGESYRDAGYRTGFFTTTLMLTNERFSRGFEEVDHLVTKGGVSGMGPALTERALRFAAEGADGDKPFMMYVHYFDPHAPYEPPEELQLRFTDEIYPDPVGLYTELRPEVPEYVANGFGPGDPAFVDQQVRYDAEIVATDAAIAQLFAGLEELGLAENTMVVITSDHGEEFLDHGFVEHAWTLYEESVHVPLLLWSPGEVSPGRVSDPVSLVDVVPTVADLQGISRSGHPTDGQALVDGAGGPQAGTAPVIGELLITHRNVVRSVAAGPWKYLQARRWLTPRQRARLAKQGERKHELRAQQTTFDLWGPVVHEELYDLSRDPSEQHDLSQSEPEQLDRMRALMGEYEKRARQTSATQQGAADEQPADQATLDAIKQIGY